MMSGIDFKRASMDDLPIVMNILTDAAAWLQEKRIDQWPSPPNEHWRRRMASAIERGEVYTVGVEENRFGIVRLTWADPYWADDGQAGYVHSMAINSDRHGQGLGAVILDWVKSIVHRQERNSVRLDCLASNGRLRRYYEEQGFTYRGKVTDWDYTAALYEQLL